MTRSTLSARVRAAALVTPVLLALAACGSSDPSTVGTGTGTGSPSASSSATADGHVAADVTFAQGMVPHHLQAVEMADIALDQARGASPKVIALAREIKGAQAPEITTMSGWLTSWGEKVPTSSAMGAMAGMDGASAMPGMMTGADMAGLRTDSSAAFDKRWLTMMVEHHTGAIEQARTELGAGRYAPARTLAQAIIDSQTKEITTMKGLLAG